MIVQQFFLEGIAHSSYLLAGEKTCAIVDPRRDVQVYLDAARKQGLNITHILETHLHADFVSGHIDLAELTGARIYVPAKGACPFECELLSDGDTIELEDMEITVLETPGHTPEHISYVVRDTSRGDEPVAVFCGDTLFVGDVGRPDLFPGQARDLAFRLYDSLHEKLLKLPDFCEVYPAHGAGSLCGRAMAAKRTSTIGYEKLYNPALQVRHRETFIDSLTNDMPAAPDHFSRCSAINGAGPTLLRDLLPLEAMSPVAFKEQVERENTSVLDVRDAGNFGGMHVPGSWSIDFQTNFATFAGWVLPPEKELLLVTENPAQAQETAVQLRRVGFDRIPGYLEGGLHDWAAAGLTVDSLPVLSADTFYEMTTGDQSIALVDVRTVEEYNENHIAGAINIPTPDLRIRYQELNLHTPTAMICDSGRRSSLGASILKMHGFTEVFNVAGGMRGYIATGIPLECPACE
jgi:hydroxyacylglutathione hydrolase